MFAGNFKYRWRQWQQADHQSTRSFPLVLYIVVLICRSGIMERHNNLDMQSESGNVTTEVAITRVADGIQTCACIPHALPASIYIFSKTGKAGEAFDTNQRQNFVAGEGG